MNRALVIIGALLFSVLSIASACATVSPQGIRFLLEPKPGSDRIEASFRSRGGTAHNNNNWSSDFRSSELVGLDVAGFRSGGARPLRFSVIREAGRIDCSGSGGNSTASGNCSLSPNPAFIRLLESRGIARPNDGQMFGLVALNVRRDLVEAIAETRYPALTMDSLMSLAALGVDGAYVRGMARAGYRPRTLDALIQFKALGITPEWIAGFVRIGYGSFPAEELAQLKALDVTADYVAGFDRLGYRHLPANKLVQLKAMNVTPEFVRSVVAEGGPMPDVDKLVELKIFDRRR